MVMTDTTSADYVDPTAVELPRTNPRKTTMSGAAQKASRASVAAFLGSQTQEYDDPEAMLAELAAHVVDEVKNVAKEKENVKKWRKVALAAVGGAILFCGVLFGLMIASSEMSKEFHKVESAGGDGVTVHNVLADGNNVVETATAQMELGLHLLPFLPLELVATMVGKPMQYTFLDTIFYELVNKVEGPPKGSGLLSVKLHLNSGIIAVSATNAMMVVNGMPYPLCGKFGCSKIALDTEQTLDELLVETVGQEMADSLPQRQHERRLAESRRLGVDYYSLPGPRKLQLGLDNRETEKHVEGCKAALGAACLPGTCVDKDTGNEYYTGVGGVGVAGQKYRLPLYLSQEYGPNFAVAVCLACVGEACGCGESQLFIERNTILEIAPSSACSTDWCPFNSCPFQGGGDGYKDAPTICQKA